MIQRLAALLGALLTLAFALPAHATSSLPLSGSQQFDVATSPPAFLNGGKLYIYQTGTTTPLTVYTNAGLTTPHPSPIILNSAGRIPAVYAADGTSARVRILNSSDVLQYDEDNIPFTVAPGGGPTPIAVTTQQLWQTGDIKVRYDDQPFDGFIRCNGRTIGSATSGATERANADTETLFKFLWPFANVGVVTGKGATAAADWSANKQLTLPDCAGRLIGARDDLGNGSASRITAATVTGPTAVGAAGGVEKGTISQAQLPNVNFTVSGITLNDPGHTHNYAQPSLAGAAPVFQSGTGEGVTTTATSSSTTGVTVATQGNAASGGSGTAFNTMPPVMLFTVYIKL